MTIVIPTYDRNRQLLETVKALLPQFGGGINMVILDNCSPVPVAETLAPHLSEYPISVVRNNCNIGADANIVRCFEYADGEWVWVLADDDVPDPNAISIVRRTIKDNPALGLINYYAPCATHPVRTQTKFSHGVGEYIANMDSFGSHLFLPSSIYRASEARKYMKIAHRNIHTLAAHLSLALCYMQNGGVACQSSETIVRFKNDYTAAVGWSRLAFGLGCSSLPDLIHDAQHRRLLRRKIASFLPFKTMYAEALIISRDRISDRYGHFMYKAAVGRIFSGVGMPKKHALGLVLALSLLFPRIAFWTVSRVLTTIKGSPPNVTRMRAAEDMLSFHWES
ncbi:glycosyltransferase family 2 protein [Aliidongia dinghuensis]|uniref:glycosyltransferase family 2 protein n=1 Tax=Aliidongia dinghuensis TaxID=1867774 RepID=UPI00166B7FA5|nr:glycosyltransferase family 2 protein [Aliidongia dinghuensis]